MATVGIRELSQHVSRCIESVISTGKPVVVTKHGRPVAAIVAVDSEGLEDFILAHAPEFTLAMHAAEEEHRRGETKPLDEALREIEAEEEAGDDEATGGLRRLFSRSR